MSEFRSRLLEELHARVLRLSEAPSQRLHPELATVLDLADRIAPRKEKPGAGARR